MRRIRSVWLCGLSALVLLVAACDVDTAEPDPVEEDPGAAPEDPPEEADEPDDTPDEGLDLASVCPDPIVLHDAWVPQPSRGYLFNMIPLDQAEWDTDTAILSGPAKVDPSVTIEVRAGGPAIGFQSISSILYSEPDVLLGLLSIDVMIQDSSEFPTTGVFSPFIKHPHGLKWATDAFPEGIESFDDIRESGATVLVAEAQTWPLVLAAMGVLDEDQLDTSFDFSPARFVADEGAFFQVTWGNLDRLIYEVELEPWGGRPISHLYAADAGYPNAVSMAARPDALEEHYECYQRLIPAMQQSWIEYLQDPTAMNEAIHDWTTSIDQVAATPEVADLTVEADIADGVVGNGPNGIIGEFVEADVEAVFEVALPVLQDIGARVDPDLTTEELFTNEFLDPSLALP